MDERNYDYAIVWKLEGNRKLLDPLWRFNTEKDAKDRAKSDMASGRTNSNIRGFEVIEVAE
jgi:hypothetical protein